MIEPAPDGHAARWLLDPAEPGRTVVDGWAVGEFGAHCRVLHPLDRWPGVQDPSVTWRQVADRAGVPLSPSARWEELMSAVTDRDPDLVNGSIHWDGEPLRGALPPHQRALLADVLSGFTATPVVSWFAVWDGWADLRHELRSAPLVQLPDRSLRLLTGSLRDAAENLGDDESRRAAALWWPDDRNWLVATDVDARSTYVSGTSECIAAVLATPDLEALPV